MFCCRPKLIPQYEPWVRRRYIRAVARQLRSGYLGPGGTTAKLETWFLSRSEQGTAAMATTSGTAALMLAIHGLGLPASSTILFPAYTMLAGAHAARALGFKVRLVDINWRTLCMDLDQLMLTLANDQSVSAVIFVDHNGYAGDDAHATRNLCDGYRVRLIEDASQALGSYRAGHHGDAVTYSFSVPKLVTGGQGGLVVFRNAEDARRANELQDQGGSSWRSTRIHENLGLNLRYNDIQAAYVLAQLDDYGMLLDRRRQVWRWYTAAGVRDCLSPPTMLQPGWCMLYVHEQAAKLVEWLWNDQIQAAQYYKAVHRNPPFATDESFPVAERAEQSLVYLPSSLTLTYRDVRRVARSIHNFERYFKNDPGPAA